MMTDAHREPTMQISPGLADDLIATAARAPSIHNTQPWRFRVGPGAIELYADPTRKVLVDPVCREMLLSCGAALFGLRLAIRSIGYLPEVALLPEPAQLRLLARVRLGSPEPPTPWERQLLAAVPHRHTHRGPFADAPLPAGLMPALQHDALAENARLAVVGHPGFEQLADIVRAVSRRQDLDPRAQADIRRWSRARGSQARDGIPAYALPVANSLEAGRLEQRDFNVGRGTGMLSPDGPPPAATVILTTRGDSRADWLRAGQALNRLLLHAATRWVFASVYTQPLEAAAIRELIRNRLELAGAPQVVLQLGVSRIAQATPRRPPSELILPAPCQDGNAPAGASHRVTVRPAVTAPA
jgi:hypothetical protein